MTWLVDTWWTLVDSARQIGVRVVAVGNVPEEQIAAAAVAVDMVLDRRATINTAPWPADGRWTVAGLEMISRDRVRWVLELGATWYTPSSSRKTCNANVAKGKHPFGMRLHSDPALRCKTCVHALKPGMDFRGYTFGAWKCVLARKSYAPTTDLILRWRACELYVKREVIA